MHIPIHEPSQKGGFADQSCVLSVQHTLPQTRCLPIIQLHQLRSISITRYGSVPQTF